LNAPQPAPQRATRAAALRALALDSPVLAEPFADLLRVAACAFGVPAALLLLPMDASLVAAARFGADAPEESGEDSPGAEVLRAGAPVAICDLAADPRFSGQAPASAGFRFYAAAPLIAADGQAVGLLCVLDRAPRAAPPAAAHLEALAALARQAVALAELRAREAELIHLRKLTDLMQVSAFQRAIVEGAGLSLIATGADAVIRSFNPAAEELTGYTAEEVIGQRSIEVLYDRREVAREVQRASLELGRPVSNLEALAGRARLGEVEVREWTLIRKDGKRVPIQLTLTALKDGAVLSGYLGIVQDLTEQHAVDRLKDEFVSTVSHELRTPLTSIRGALGLLDGGIAGELPEIAREMVSIAVSNSDRLIRLVNDILDVEKMKAGKLALNLVKVDPGELVKTALREMRPLGDAAALELRASIESEGTLVADPDRLLQVLVNLLSNAIKFSPPNGSVLLRVAGSSSNGGTFRFSVADQGPGIEPQNVRKLFRHFQQLDSSDTRVKGGTGLGLAIARDIVEQHHGRIWVETEPGKGAVFSVELPAEPPPSAA
jgi:PAS domain S-box-containing protein